MEEISSMKLGQYTLLRRLARGGMSEIYLVSHEGSKQICALKIVRCEDEEYSQCLEREVLALTTLKHEHIIPTLDSGKQDGLCYYAMPYIESGSLKERIVPRPLMMEEAGAILTQIAEALHFLHTHGIIHRDIKPGNILVDATDHVWLIDFGLANNIEGVSNRTDTNHFLGTPYYMAPELVEKPASTSSDIYALGVVVYEMLTGTVPFTGPTPVVICWKHMYDPPPFPSKLNPLISPAIEQVILRALAKHPQTRYATALELAEAYQQALTLPVPIRRDLSFSLAQTQPISLDVKPIQASILARQRRRFARPLVAALALFALGLTSLGLVSRRSLAGPAAGAAQTIAVPAQAIPASPAFVQPGLSRDV
jgi:serine/threonine protein kinase